MSGLWTPDGEREAPQAQAPAEASEIDPDVVEEIAQLEAELLAAPVEEVVANHCYGLFQLAALHLGQHPPNLVPAKLAIDAFGALVDTLGDRLGAGAGTLRDGLAQLRLAYVQISAASEAADDAPEA